MSEYFVVARTFAAPFVSETIEQYIEAATPAVALEELAVKHRGGFGIFSAVAYATADAYHRNHAPLARWLSNKALAVEGAASIRSDGPGKVEVDGRWITVDDPKAGRIVA